jgi:hypothetical protein
MTDWRIELIKALGGRCQYVDPETGKQCEVTDLSRLELHHITDTPLGNERDRRIEIREWRRTGRLPQNEEVRCDDHHKLETAIQIGDEIAAAKWRVKLRQKREAL